MSAGTGLSRRLREMGGIILCRLSIERSKRGLGIDS